MNLNNEATVHQLRINDRLWYVELYTLEKRETIVSRLTDEITPHNGSPHKKILHANITNDVRGI